MDSSAFNITDFPTEILEKIFWHFDDTTAATATSVCKRFNEVLHFTVPRKYNGSSRNKWYEMEILNQSNEHNEIVQHRPFILKRASTIKLTFRTDFNNRDHWIHQVITRIGRNVNMIHLATPLIDDRISLNFYDILSKTPNISHFYVDYVYPSNRKWCHQRYRKLTDLKMKLRLFTFDHNELKPFVRNNGQLKNVTLEINDFNVLYAFDQTKIESLHCRFSHISGKDIPVKIQPMRIAHLKSMNLEVPKNSMNECVEKIVAPCQNLQELHLMDFDFTLTDKTMDILCSFRTLETFVPCFRMPLKNIVRLIDNLPKLVSISLWYKFTIADYRVLLEVANKHPSLRHIRLEERMTDLIYNKSVLIWLMENVNNRLRIEHSLCYKLVITKGKVEYDGVAIMKLNESPIEYGNVTHEWLQRIQFIACIDEPLYEFFSNLEILKAHFDEKENTDLYLCDRMDESTVKRRGTNIITASTTLSSNYDKSVSYINWLEKYCHRLLELSIYIEYIHPQLQSTWTFPDLNVFRINCRRQNQTLDLNLVTSFQCPQLNCLKFTGIYPMSVTNVQVIHDINLFDNLVSLEIFHFDESKENLLEQFNRNVQNNLRYLTLANRRVNGERYIMNNKTITALSKYKNLIQLKLILPGLNEINSKFLFENFF